MRNFLGPSAKHACFVFSLLSLLLSSCQGPKVTVVLNRLQPQMLKGKTVGVEGMEITGANWPGKFIEEPILGKAEKVLQQRLKDAHVCLLNEDGTVQESSPRVKPAVGAGQSTAAKTRGKEPDYIFRIMLRADNVNHVVVKQSLVGTGRLPERRSMGYWAFTTLSWWPGTGDNWVREINKRVMKAEYSLSDGRTHQLLWRAEAVSAKQFQGNYRRNSVVEAQVPRKPFWIAMNTAAVKAIAK